VAPGRPRAPRSRRVSLPGAAELLRPSGRASHPQKITVYLSGSELPDLERTRLTPRALGITVDRGRILADLDAEGDKSLVARRLWEGTLAY
jgi:hypothetical protein